MRDNTRTKLDKGPKGRDQRALTVEAARRAVDNVNINRDIDQSDRFGRRPVHAAGLFLGGHLKAEPGAEPFTSPLFHGTPASVVARLSPTRSGTKERRFDLHGLAVRITANNDLADATDLVALNTHPFMFQSADDFTLFLSRLHGGVGQLAIGLGAFGFGAIAGTTSLRALDATISASMRATRPLPGRSYWGIHTFFASYRLNQLPSSKIVRVPYRYRLDIRENSHVVKRGPGKVLGRYRDVATVVRAGHPIFVELWFMLAWRWDRLTDWPNVPDSIRQGLLNPIVSWTNGTLVHMATLELDTVLDAGALDGSGTDPTCDSMMFDPTQLSDGLYASSDPLLRARSGVYAESHMRRP